MKIKREAEKVVWLPPEAHRALSAQAQANGRTIKGHLIWLINQDRIELEQKARIYEGQ